MFFKKANWKKWKVRDRTCDLPDFYVSIKSSFKLKNYWVSGIAPKDGGKHVLLLTVSKEDPTRPPRWVEYDTLEFYPITQWFGMRQFCFLNSYHQKGVLAT